MNIDKKEISSGIISLRFDTQYECCSTFMRLQEFYESPFKEIRGKKFSLEQFMDRYAKANKNFTYTQDWSGFNVPGEIARKFYDMYGPEDMLIKERRLFDLIMMMSLVKNATSSVTMAKSRALIGKVKPTSTAR